MKFVLLVLFMLAFVPCFSQQAGPSGKGSRLSGRVIDSASRRPIEYATITLFEAGTKKVLNGTTTNPAGEFVVSDAKPGDRTVVIESIGYHSHRIEQVTIGKGAVDLKDIMLSKSQKTLDAVTVTAPGIIENKIDKMVYNAEKDLTSQGGVAIDILKKVPQVSVDVDGNVELAGSTSIRFLINGKPSTAFGSSITDVLQSIPASQIKSIEVLTNPGAKYDAEGLGGIINIILKSSKANGVNGSVSVTGGNRNENGSFNINARHGNLGINAFASGNFRLLSKTPFESERVTADTANKTNSLLKQNGEYDFKRHGYQTGIGFDWTYKTRNSFTGSLNYSSFGNSNTGQITQSQTTTDAASGNILSSVMTSNPSSSSFAFHTVDVSLGYKHKFAREDQELEASANASFGNNLIKSTSNQYWLPQDSLFFGTVSTNPGKEREAQFQIDYTQPIKENVKFAVGGKLSIRNIISGSTINSFQPTGKDYFYDSALSNNLTYDQKVYAAYTEISLPVYNWFETKVGVRYERTEINAFYSNAQQKNINSGYNTFVPSIYFLKKIGDNQTLKLSYSKRIERPDYRDLNPFINTTDPKNITAGNPYLQPEIGQRIEFSYSRNFEKAGSVTATAFYRENDGDIQPYIVYYPELVVGDTTYHDINVTTNRNIGTEKNMGLSLFADMHPGSRFGVRTNVFLFERHTINAIDSGYNSNSFNYRINVNMSYQFKGDFAAEFFGNFNSPRNEAQGRYPSFTTYSFALRKQIWNKKGSIVLTATNPFAEYVTQKTELFGPNFNLTSTRKIPFRSIAIGFTWKFGKLKFAKEREENRDNLATPDGS